MRTLVIVGLCSGLLACGSDDDGGGGGSGAAGGASGSGAAGGSSGTAGSAGSGGSSASGGSSGSGGSAGSGGAPVVCTEEVTSVTELETAVSSLGPGKTVCLAPGDYVLGSRLVLAAGQSGDAASPAVIAARDGLGSVTIDAAGAEEAIWLNGASYVTITGLRITGGAYHALKIDPPSAEVFIVGNVLFENTTAGDAGAQYSAIKGCCLAQRTVIENNEIYETGCASTNLQGVDCNGCKGWEVRGNRIHGIRVGTSGGTAIQFKSGSADTIIENNVIWDSLVGINYGGFGNPQQWGNETFEHLRGVVRNNIVYGCLDAGISVINNKDGKVYNNTLFDNGFTPDVRVAAENLQYRNNILDRALNLRDGTTAAESNNIVLSTPSDGSFFVDAAVADFHLVAGAAPIDQGADLAPDVPLDFDGETRPKGAAFDCGADERP